MYIREYYFLSGADTFPYFMPALCATNWFCSNFNQHTSPPNHLITKFDDLLSVDKLGQCISSPFQ